MLARLIQDSWFSVDWPAAPAPSPTQVIYTAIVMAVVCCLFFHGYEVFNFTLSIDEELMRGSRVPTSAVAQGRWGVALCHWLLMPDATLSITPIATGLALYGAAFVFLITKFRISALGLGRRCCAIVFRISCPCLRHCVQHRVLAYRHRRFSRRRCRLCRGSNPSNQVHRGRFPCGTCRLPLSVIPILRYGCISCRFCAICMAIACSA